MLFAAECIAQYTGTLIVPYYRAGPGFDCADPIAVARFYSPDYSIIGLRDCAIRHGNGPSLEFQSRNLAGQWHAGAVANGGLIDATPGAEQGDLDVRLIVDGVYGPVIALTGRYAGQRPGILPWPSDLFWLGSDANQWGGAWLTLVPCPLSAPARECVRVSGAYVPIYR